MDPKVGKHGVGTGIDNSPATGFADLRFFLVWPMSSSEDSGSDIDRRRNSDRLLGMVVYNHFDLSYDLTRFVYRWEHDLYWCFQLNSSLAGTLDLW